MSGNLAVLPSSVPVGADVGAIVHDAASRVLGLIDEDSTLDDLADLGRRWDAFVAMVDARRRGGQATAQAVARRIEREMGHRLLRMKASDIPTIHRDDAWMCRTFARFDHVVEDVLSSSTNASPPTRNRCLNAIRYYREQVGDIPVKGRRRTRPTRRPTGVSRPEVDGADLARQVGGDTSALYSLIRRALKVHEAIDPASDVVHAAIGRALIEAEAQCVVLLQVERRTS